MRYWSVMLSLIAVIAGCGSRRPPTVRIIETEMASPPAGVPPMITLSGDSSVDEGSKYSLTLSASDPGGAPITHWEITWESGGPVDTVWGWHPGVVKHIYPNGPASKTITVKGYDVDGTYGQTTKTITVNDVLATRSVLGETFIGTDHGYGIELSAVDPGTDVMSWRIDWGDGSAADPATGNGPLVLAHTYPSNIGSYTISVTSSDSGGHNYGTMDPVYACPAKHYYSISILSCDVGGAITNSSGRLRIKPKYDAIGADDNAGHDDETDVYVLAATPEAAVREAIESCNHENFNYADQMHVEAGYFDRGPALDYSATYADGNDDVGWSFETEGNNNTVTLYPKGTTNDGAEITWHLGIRDVTLSLSVVDTAIEGHTPSSPPKFTVSRDGSGVNEPALDVDLAYGGSAISGDDFQGLPASITIAARNASYDIPVTVLDDNISEWTETIVASLLGNTRYRVRLYNGQQTEEIVDQDLGISGPGGIILCNFDDDDSNGVPDYMQWSSDGQDDDLHELTLTVPAYLPGATATIWMAPAIVSKVKVWDSKTKGRLIIGGPPGASATVDLTQADPLSHQIIFYQEAVDGSDTVGDIVLHLTASQVGAP